ncbi:MAG: hypothetical protein ACK559_16680, partial [bacterium]
MRVFVEPGSLVARITIDDDYQAPSAFALQEGSEIRLDGLSSFDSDYGEGFEPVIPFHYFWSCKQIYPDLSDICGFEVADGDWSNHTLRAFGSLVNTTNVLSLIISDHLNRSSSISTTVQVVPMSIPDFRVSAVVSTSSLVASSSTMIMINADQKLKIEGSIVYANVNLSSSFFLDLPDIV